ncbi:MAG: gliding motility-associated C-terminal domain-containing protein [Saprospiraceae bacterium]|nr:gliding motility-associated C-terminal domain-containing protein [Saprospiraceae bacterium]
MKYTTAYIKSNKIQFTSNETRMNQNNSMIIKSLKTAAFLLLAFLCSIDTASATHIVGGELKYRHIENDRYEITLTFRRDCLLGAPDAGFDNPANVWIFNGNGNLQTQLGVGGRLKMNFNASDTLNNIIMSDCGFEGAQVCVHETSYKEIVRLPYNPDGYILSYQRCCRNASLENVLEPLITGGTWTVELSDEAQLQNNSSPSFVKWPDIYICANEDLNFDHSATDIDGDSLVYKLCTPFLGAIDTMPIPVSAPAPPYIEVPWKFPYGLNDMLGGTPLTIDSETGLLTGNPNLVGQFLVGICVEEYRDGVKIGEVRRDFQYNVRVCSPSPSSEFTANDGDCDGQEVEFSNESEGGTEYQWNFNYPSTDSIYFSNEVSPTFVYPEPGVYEVQLIVTRGTDECSDTLIQQIAAIVSDIGVKYNLQIQECNEDGGYNIRLIDQSFEPEIGFDIINAEWDITQNGMTQSYVGKIINLQVDAADFIVKLQVESETGCKKTLIDTVEISDFEHFADFVYELDGCSDFGVATLAFGDNSEALNIYDDIEGYLWTIEGPDSTSTFTDSSFLYNVADDATISVNLALDFGGGCNAEITKEIVLQEVVPQASFDLIANGCPDDGTVDITYFNNTSGLDSGIVVAEVEWSITVADSIYTGTGDSIEVNVPKDSTVSITMIVVFSNGCQDIVEDAFVPGPFANIAFDIDPLIICLGDTMSNVSSPNSDFTYTWTPMDGLFFEDPDDLSDPGFIGVESTMYTVLVSDGLCSIESTIEVTVLDDNNLSISGDSITCDGDVLLVADGGIGEGFFEWSLTSDFETVIYTGDTLVSNFEGQEQTFYVRFTGESCNDPFAEYTVILSNIFDVAFNGEPVRVCLGDTVPLLANPDPTLTYQWSPLEGIYFLDSSDSSTAQVIGIKDTEYFVTISDDFCSLDTSTLVVISDKQDFQVLGDSIVCDENVQLIGTGATGIGTYQWSLDDDFSTILYEGDTLNTILTGLSETYYVQFTDKTCGDLILSYDVRQFVFDLEYAEIIKICPGDTLDYTVFNTGEGPLDFVWSEDPHIVANDSTSMPTIGVGEDEEEDFDLYFTATSPTGCTFTDTILFQIMENPTVDFSFDLQNCGEFTVCFELIGDYNGFPSWNFGDTTVTTDIDISETPCYTYPGAGIYEVVLSNLTSFCAYEDVIKTITINDDITIDPIEDAIVCLNDTVFLNATSSDFGISYVWCSLAGDTLAVGPDFEQVVTEEFDVIVKAEDPNGCTDMDTIKVGPFEFDVMGTVPEVFCDSEDTVIEITVNGTQAGYSYAWGPEDCVVSGGDTANPTLLTNTGKEYSVTITYDELGCEVIKTYPVTITSFEIDLDAIDLDGNNSDTINKTEEIIIFVVDPEDGYSYEWSTGEINDTGEITVSPEETTTYSVTVTDEMGCTATDSITIFVRQPMCDETDVFLPSAFTPNGDNINDVLYLRSNFIDEMELLIYNRWGEQVFSTIDQNVGWDGTYNGATLAPDAYAYTLRVICINQAEYNTRGNVSLMK